MHLVCPPEILTELTRLNPFERYPTGRPRVPDELIERMKLLALGLLASTLLATASTAGMRRSTSKGGHEATIRQRLSKRRARKSPPLSPTATILPRWSIAASNT